MRRITLVLRELLGLFVDDAPFALTVLAWLVVFVLVLPRVLLPLSWRGTRRKAMSAATNALSKAPEATLGETGGDTVTMTLTWGYLAAIAIFLVALIVLVVAQILAKRFQPFIGLATMNLVLCLRRLA